ncbi:MAG: serine/threonine protein kinase [Myxococcales bacterium]|nr:serine/threonine protein kinase [Myxococcales bacterium]
MGPRSNVLRVVSENERVTSPGSDELIGRTLDGRFRIVEPIGAGAMGRVYRAVQAPFDRPVALKVLDKSAALASDPAFRKRFLLEAALTSKLRHPNTVTVIDYGCTREGVYYLAMEYLSGETLEELLDRVEALPWERALFIAAQICRSLREAHNLGLVHRDLKPANVMLLSSDSDTDQVKVLDFGLVKSFIPGGQSVPVQAITQQGVFLGSPHYVAPEQAEHNQADPRSDIYSLGVLLYESLTGKPPFTGKSVLEVVSRHLSERPPPMAPPRPELAIPPPVHALVARCLEKDPDRRFQSMDEVLEALQRAGAPERRRPRRRRRWAVPLMLAASAALGGGGVLAAQWMTAPSALAELVSRVNLGAALLAKPVVRQLPEPEPERKVAFTSPATVRFRIDSLPQGARVAVAGKVIGTTPVELDLPSGPDGRASASLALSLQGHHPLSFTASAPGPRVELLQKLQAIKPEPKRRVRPTKAKSPAQGASAARLDDEEPEAAEEDSTPAESSSELKRPEP